MFFRHFFSKKNLMADPPPLNGKSRKKNSIFFGTSLITTQLPGSKEGNHFLKVCFANKNSKLKWVWKLTSLCGPSSKIAGLPLDHCTMCVLVQYDTPFL